MYQNTKCNIPETHAVRETMYQKHLMYQNHNAVPKTMYINTKCTKTQNIPKYTVYQKHSMYHKHTVFQINTTWCTKTTCCDITTWWIPKKPWDITKTHDLSKTEVWELVLQICHVLADILLKLSLNWYFCLTDSAKCFYITLYHSSYFPYNIVIREINVK